MFPTPLLFVPSIFLVPAAGLSRRLLTWVMGGIMVLISCHAQAEFAGGDGSSGNPWQITTAEQLADIRHDLDAHYRIMAGLDLGDVAWTPIGTQGAPFKGYLDGGHHAIAGLMISEPAGKALALFAFTEGATLHNVVLENVDVSGDWYVAGLVARAERTVIVNSSVTGNVSASGPYAGGLAAEARDTVVSGSYSAADVEGTQYVGGVVGIMVSVYSEAWLINSFSVGSVAGTSEPGKGVGGLLGNARHQIMRNTYFAGTLTDNGDEITGALTGYQDFGQISHSLWNTNLATGLDAFGGIGFDLDAEENLSGLSTAVMQGQSVFTDAGWNFTSVWTSDPGINNGYPMLRWQLGFTDSPPLPFPRLKDRNININAPFELNLAEHFLDPDAGDLGFTVSGDLPQGLAFDAATGVITGTPTLQGSCSLQVTATDAGGSDYTATTSFALNVQPAFDGEGTVASPWEIDSAEKLDAVRNVLGAHFVLTADIDLSGSEWSEGWQPLGSAQDPFSGSFNGNDFSITGLVVKATGDERAGLFGRVLNAELHNLQLTDVQVNGHGFVGGLAGAASLSTISNVSVEGDISVADASTDGWAFGGLVGFSENTEISGSEFAGTVSGLAETGGLVGRVATAGSVSNSSAEATVSGTSRVGGLMGFLHADSDTDPDHVARVERSHAHGTVTAEDRAGGLIGEATAGTVTNSHAGGNISGDTITGGLFGRVNSNSVITDVYFQGAVSGRLLSGGLAGEMVSSELARAYTASTVQGDQGSAALVASIDSATINASFWHQALANGQTGFADSTGSNQIDVGALSAEAMQARDTYLDAAWDFSANWDMQAGGGLPYQQWAPEFFSSPPVLLSTIPDSLLLPEGNFALMVTDLIVEPLGGSLDVVVSGLPAGVTFNAATGVISGNSQHWGDHVITITARNERDETLAVNFTLTFLPYETGDGSSGFGWRVATAEQLRAMRLRPGDHYFMIADIDLQGSDWTPAGTADAPFTGSLAGNGYTISGLMVDTNADQVGLFGATEGAMLTNIRIDSASISGADNVGILAGKATDTQISRVSVTGTVNGGSYVGGLAGAVSGGSMDQVYAQVAVEGAMTVGALAGLAEESPVTNASVDGDVRASGFVSGGMFGSFEGAEIKNSYSNVAIVNWEEAMFAGALAGFRTDATFVNVFWNADNMPGMAPGGFDTDISIDDTEGLTGDELIRKTSYPDLADIEGGWDFEAVWGINANINAGLPYLRWMAPNAVPTLTRFPEQTRQELAIPEDGSLRLTRQILLDASDANDEDGGIAAFIVKSVASGTLMIGGRPFDANTNNVIGFSSEARWHPAANANGILPAFSMTVRDDDEAQSTTPVLLHIPVTAVNDTPQLLNPIPDQSGVNSAVQGEAFSLNLRGYFSDVDADVLTFAMSGLPDGLHATDAGTVSGIPTNTAALGSPYPVTVTASDGFVSASDSFVIAVTNVNDAPVLLSEIEDRMLITGEMLDLDLSGYFDDPDNDILSISVSDLPADLVSDAVGRVSGITDQAGVYTVTVVAADPDDASVTTDFNLVVNAPPVVESQSPVINSEQNNVNQSGTVTVTESGVLNGGSINGTINNSGTVTGNIQLGPGSQINGGTISGVIQGSATQPARISDASIVAGATLENVVVGANVVLDPAVQLGSNVTFATDSNIPPALDLTPALKRLAWTQGDEREVIDLDDDVLTSDNGAMSIIRSIQLMNDFEPAGNQAVQDDSNGEIRVTMSDTRHSVLPVKVSKAATDEEEGVYINSDGDVVLVTGSRRVVVNHPVLDSNPAFRDALAAMGLGLDFDARTNLIVSELDVVSGKAAGDAGQWAMLSTAVTSPAIYYAGRPDISAVPAHRSNVPGLHSHAVPGLANVEALSLVFTGEDGTLLEQDIVPVPAHWPVLKQSLQRLPGASDVRIDTLGVISLRLDGQLVQGRMEYLVEPSSDGSGTGLVAFDTAGDVNHDGIDDFQLRYPNGDRQLLYVYP